MIQYKRLDTPEDGLKDVLAITDDGNAEMAALEEMIAECEFDIELPDKRNVEDNNFQFTIPGALVGDFSEVVWDIDNGELENCMEKWNEQIVEEAEKADG